MFCRSAVSPTLVIVALVSVLSPKALAQTTIPDGTTITSDTIWNVAGSPYVLGCGITVTGSATLTVSPGVVVKSSNGPCPALFIDGRLVAAGTAGAPIFFTSLADDTVAGDTNGDGNATTPQPGDWSGIIFRSGSTGSISNAVIRYGSASDIRPNGQTFAQALGMIHVASGNSSVSITNNTITDGAMAGVYATGYGTNVTISANMFSRNQSNGGVYLSGAGAAVSGNSFSSNYQAITAVGGSVLTATNNTISLVNPARSNPTGIYLDNSGSGSLANNTITTSSGGTAISINAGYRGSLSGNTSTGAGMNAVAIRPSALVQNTSWNQLSMPYWSCDVTVPSGMMLTIAAGIVVKNGCEFNGGVPFPGGGSDVALSIAGQLIANGTQASPIVFTSLWDDTVAGDTNGDGNATSPGPGNWDGIVFQAGSTGSISNAVLKYGAGFQYMGNGGIIAAAKGMIHIASGNSSVSVTNSTITGGALYGIYISGTSTNVTVRGNTVAANSTGVGVAGGAGPHVNSNYIYSNTNYGVINADCPNLGACSITPTVDAKNNWWGSSSGPWLDVPKPLGSGDRVSYHVTVTPYSFSGPANSAPTYTLGPGGTSRNPTRTIAGPVNTATGNYYTSITDLQAPTRGIGFLFARSYNSGDTYSGPLGPGWTHSYNLILFVNADLTVSIKEEDGGVITFAPSGASYAPQTAGVFDSLAKNSDSLEESVG